MMRRTLLVLAVSSAAGLSCGLPRAAPACSRSQPAAVRMLAKKSKKAANAEEVVAAPAEAVAVEPVAVEQVAVEPVAAEVMGGWDSIFPVEQPQLWEAHRVTAKAPSYDQVFQALSATPDESLRDFVNVNRDLLDYRFMYQMTGNVLRKQNTGDAAGSAELRTLRDEVLRWAQRFDAALFQAIVAAEGRLGQLLAQYMTPGASPSAEEVVQAAGSKPLEVRASPPPPTPPPPPAQVFAFWLVVRSAAAAWRLKLGMDSVAELAEQKLKELSEVAEAIEAQPEASMARRSLGQLPQLLAIGDIIVPAAASARTQLAAIEPEAEAQLRLLRAAGCVACACQRHAFEAYNPMVRQAAGVYDTLLYGEPRGIEGQDIASPKREGFESRLVQMAFEADASLPKEYRQLFW